MPFFELTSTDFAMRTLVNQPAKRLIAVTESAALARRMKRVGTRRHWHRRAMEGRLGFDAVFRVIGSPAGAALFEPVPFGAARQFAGSGGGLHGRQSCHLRW